MLFSSWTFLLIFLPIVISVYFLLPVKGRNAFLLVASLFFYSWGQVSHIWVILGVILVNYLAGLAIDRYRNRSKFIIFLSVALNILVLGVYKYADFLIGNINNISGAQLEELGLALPIGISFYTFQALSYSVDVYRQVVPVQRNPFKLALYIALFPQLIAGPIVKYHDIMAYIDNRESCLDEVVAGIRIFVIGLAKKVVIADTVGQVADMIFAMEPASLSAPVAWLGAIAYSLQIFFDFSGYSDMAIGLGRIFGFRFMVNFNYPYISRCLTEFWRRWHISLSTWFRDYVYISLGGNRCSLWQNNINLIAVFFLTGLWHGASWTFVVWGLWHGMFLLLEKRLWFRGRKLDMVMGEISECTWKTVLAHGYAIMVFVIGWVIFRADSLGYAADYISVMLGGGSGKDVYLGIGYFLHSKAILVGAVALLLCRPWGFSVVAEAMEPFSKIILKDAAVLMIFLMSLMFMAAGTYNPFIYFRF